MSRVRDFLLQERNRIDADERYHYDAAKVDINAPLALVQVQMKSKMDLIEQALAVDDSDQGVDLLSQVWSVLMNGGDFQLGPEGKHRHLIDKIGAFIERNRPGVLEREQKRRRTRGPGNRAHVWEPHPDSETIRRPFERVRVCAKCGKEQTWESDHEWGRVVRRYWYPRVGRCRSDIKRQEQTS